MSATYEELSNQMLKDILAALSRHDVDEIESISNVTWIGQMRLVTVVIGNVCLEFEIDEKLAYSVGFEPFVKERLPMRDVLSLIDPNYLNLSEAHSEKLGEMVFSKNWDWQLTQIFSRFDELNEMMGKDRLQDTILRAKAFQDKRIALDDELQ